MISDVSPSLISPRYRNRNRKIGNVSGGMNVRRDEIREVNRTKFRCLQLGARDSLQIF